MTVKPLLLALTLVSLSACGQGDRKTSMSREHDMKATTLCKRDKGLKQVLEASGPNFTAECKSGIIVTGTLG